MSDCNCNTYSTSTSTASDGIYVSSSTATPLYYDYSNIGTSTGTAYTYTINGYRSLTSEDVDDIKEALKEALKEHSNPIKPKNKENTEKENKNMSCLLNFGPIQDACGIRLSPCGVAVQNKEGRWVAFNKETNEITNVDSFVMNPRGTIYQIPVAIKDIAVGDAILHNGSLMFIVDISTQPGKFFAVDPCVGEEVKIIPTKNIFGFNYVTKIVSLLDFQGNGPSEDNPFGDMLPFMMMSENSNFDPTLLMLLNKDKEIDQKTLMMLMMCGDSSKANMLPLLLMMNK